MDLLFYNVDGKDRTAFFYTEGQFICAGESFTYGIQAKENYQAIEDAEVYVFDKSKVISACSATVYRILFGCFSRNFEPNY